MERAVVISSAILLSAMVLVAMAYGEGYAGKPELLGKRTLTSKTFDNENGTYTAVISTEPVHYLDDNNVWQDIDTRIRPLHGVPPTGYDYAADANLIRIFFAKGKKESGTLSGVTFQTDVEGFHFVPYEKAIERDGSILFSERIRHTPERTSVEGSEIRFHGQFGEDGDVAYEVRRGALIQRIYLPQMPDLAMEYDGEDDFLVYRFFFGKSMRADDRRKLPLYVDGRLIEEDFSISKEMEFRSYYDNTILGFSGSKVYEVDGKRRSTFCPNGVHFGTSHSIFLSLRIPLSWLKQPDRTFPVVIENRLRVKRYSRMIDHTGGSAKIASISDDLNLDDYLSVYQYDGGSYDWTWEFLVGRDDSREEGRSNQKYRAWLKWDTSSIPDGSDVTSATFDLDCTFFESASAISMKANSMENEPYWGQDEQTAWEDCGDGTTYQTFTVNSSAWSGSFDNDSDFNAAIENHLSEDWIAIGFKSESEGTNPSWAEFYTGVPLTVVYTPITVSNVQITDLVDNQATISWTTDPASWTILNWDVDTIYDNTYIHSTLKTSHSVTITDLSASTYYYFRIGTKAGEGAPYDANAYTGNFTTLAAGRYVPVEYSTIQSAINAASSGEIVYVSAGTYNEGLSLKSGVDLIKSGGGTVTVTKSNGTAATIYNKNDITTDGINFTGFGYGVDINNSTNITIKNGTLVHTYADLACAYLTSVSSNVTFRNCTFDGQNRGLQLNNADPTIRHATITGNSRGVYGTNHSEPILDYANAQNDNENNKIYGNTLYDVYFTSDCGHIDAEWIWWGESPPNTSQIYHGQGSSYIDYDPYRTSSFKIAAFNGTLQAAIELNETGRELMRQRDYEGALSKFKEVLRGYPDTEVARFSLDHAATAYWNMGRWADAVAYLEGIHAQHGDSDLGAEALYLTIKNLIRQHEYQRAEWRADEVVGRYPTSTYAGYALLSKGTLYLHGYGDKGAADGIFRQIIKRYPGHEAIPIARVYLVSEGGSAEQHISMETEEILLQNAPNPFNPRTAITFTLPKAALVTLEIYTPLGQVVKTLVDGDEMEVGRYAVVWDGKDASGQDAASGLYLYSLRAGDFTAIKKMLLLR